MLKQNALKISMPWDNTCHCANPVCIPMQKSLFSEHPTGIEIKFWFYCQNRSNFKAFHDFWAKKRSQKDCSFKVLCSKVNFAVVFYLGLPKNNTYYSNSMVAGGFPVQSYKTRFTCFTSLIMRLVTVCSTGHGISADSAVIKSIVVTARSATA